MKVHLVDGTYELFRSHFGAPPKKAPDGREIGATIGLLKSLLWLASSPGTTHVACAFDRVVESFRNDLYPGYKSSEGMPQELLDQFPLAEEAVAAMGLVVWSMIEFEADDALATAVSRFKDDPTVDQIIVCTPDKDLAQVISGDKVVSWDRRRDIVLNADGVVAKYGVRPHSIPDWLALVGDSADRFPGVPGWGAKSAATVLLRFEHLESIPMDVAEWGLGAARGARLAESLANHAAEVVLYRQLATLRTDVPLTEDLADLEWRGAHERLRDLCRDLGEDDLPTRIDRWQP